MIDRDAYCRELEAHLCRKNDGHLIRIVGPAFERVLSWAAQGIPIRVAEAGIDRYFERYYRKGPRRRPVRIEFCEADVLDAFDDWRRAVGVSVVAADVEGGPPVEEPVEPPARARRSLEKHIEGVTARLTGLRGSDRLGPVADAALDEAVRRLDGLRGRAHRARGDERDAAIAELHAVDAALVAALGTAIGEERRRTLLEEAEREIAPFKARMAPETHARARDAAFARLVRDACGIPVLTF